jgi:hypothetical protein
MHSLRRCSSVQAERPVEARKATGATPVSGTTLAPFGYGLVSCPFKAVERVRIPHGVPVSRSSVVESAALIQRRSEVQFLPGQRRV